MASSDLTAGDRSAKVSENDYGIKVPVTAARGALQRQAGRARECIRGGGPRRSLDTVPGPLHPRVIDRKSVV